MPSLTALRRLTAGAAPVGVGLLVLGGSSYVVLGVAGHALLPREYTSLASLYLLTAIVSAGIFAAVEQQTNREVSRRIAAGESVWPAVRSATVVAAGLTVVVTALVLALSPWLVPGTLGGSWTLLVGVVISVFGSAAAAVERGLFAGERRYLPYAVSLSVEGLVRVVPVLLLAATGSTDAGVYGIAYSLGAGVAALVGLPATLSSRGTPTTAERPVPVGPLARSTFLLASALGLTFLVANLAPLVLTSRLPAQPDLAASFVSLFVLARTPMFLFGPLQAFLLPTLTAGAERGDAAHVRARLRVALVAVGAVGGVGVLFAALLGPWVAVVFFDAPLLLSVLPATMLGLSTAVMMAGQILQPALVAMGANRLATGAWLAGAVVFVGLLFLPGDPVVAAVAAQVGGPAVVVLVMFVAVHRCLGAMTPAVPNPEVTTPESPTTHA